MKKLGIWLSLALLAVSIGAVLGAAFPVSVEYYDLLQYSFPSGDYMHVAVSPRGNDIYVGLGRRLITIDADQGVLARLLAIPRDSVVDFEIPNYVEFTEADANYCYVSTGSRLRVFRVQPPWRINREPLPVKSIRASWTIEGMIRSGNTLYVATRAEWFYIYNIANRNVPVLLNEGHINVGCYALDIAIEGDYAFLSTADGLRIVDISNKKNPKVVAKKGNILNSDSHAGIAVFTKNKITYVLLVRTGGLYIYEYDPDTPSQITFLDKIKEYRNTESYIDRSIGIVEDVAMLKIGASVYALIGTNHGLFVADVTAPNRARVVGYLLRNNRTSVTYDVVSIAVRGTTAYLAERVRGYHVGIRVVDVSMPVGGGTYP